MSSSNNHTTTPQGLADSNLAKYISNRVAYCSCEHCKEILEFALTDQAIEDGA